MRQEPATGHELLWQSFVEGARADGSWPLSETQWRLARAILEHYWAAGEAPALVRVARSTGLGRAAMFAAFPFGPVQSVFRLAGLPYPTGHCLRRPRR
jgi:sulfur relay (sulfurtransferase) DsrC/TusE family protein